MNEGVWKFYPFIYKLLIDYFYNDNIWLQLPEFIWFLLFHWNLSILLKIKQQ